MTDPEGEGTFLMGLVSRVNMGESNGVRVRQRRVISLEAM